MTRFCGRQSLIETISIIIYSNTTVTFLCGIGSSPCGHGVIHNALTFSSLSSPESEALPAGTIPDDWCGGNNYLWEYLASFVIPPHVKSHDNIPTGILEADILHGFKGWKESTSTLPSGQPLGHNKALIQHPIMLKCFALFMNIVVVLRSIAIPRWCQATNIMIEKDAGKPCIHCLRIIHLFEADHNISLKLQLGHRLVWHAVSVDLFHDLQHGSIPQWMAMNPIMLTQLTSNLYRITKHDLARFDNNALACYNWIIMDLGHTRRSPWWGANQCYPAPRRCHAIHC